MHRRLRTFDSLRNGLLGLWATLASCGSSGDGRLAVVVRLEGVAPQVTGLEVSAALDGTLASNAVMQITSDFSQFVVYLPPTTQGDLQLDIGALQSPMPCQTARVQLRTTVHPAPPRVIELKGQLQPASPMQCPITVDLVGDGSLQATSGTLFCNTTQCRGVFPQNSAVTLNGVPGARSSTQVTWSAPCPTLGSSCTVTPAQKLQLTATFSGQPCNPNGFCQHNVPVNGSNLRSVWSRGPNDVWVVGVNSTVIHYDGKRWTPVPVTPADAYTFYGVASTGPTDIVVGGSVGTGVTTGVVFSYNGSQWTQSAAPEKTVRDIWLGSPSSGRGVGDAGALYARNGSSWSGADNTVTGKVYWSVWGTGSIEYIVGSSGFIGTAAAGTTNVQPLTQQPPPATDTLDAVWGVSATDVWAVGYNGAIGTINLSAASV